jgi:hypothetical protein
MLGCDVRGCAGHVERGGDGKKGRSGRRERWGEDEGKGRGNDGGLREKRKNKGEICGR